MTEWSTMTYAAFGLFCFATGWAGWQVRAMDIWWKNEATTREPNPRRLMQAGALWECSIALVILSTQGIGTVSIIEAIVLIMTAVLMWVSTKLIKRKKKNEY